MWKYVRTKYSITTDDVATHELIKDITCAGYFRTLKAGVYVKIGKEWLNYYGHWVDIIDEKGRHYSIRPDEVSKVTKELPIADTIDKLCDLFVKRSNEPGNNFFEINKDRVIAFDEKYNKTDLEHYDYYGAILTDKGLLFVAKLDKDKQLNLIR